MKCFQKYFRLLGLLLFVFADGAIAGTNPIKWDLNTAFQVPVITGRTYAITYTFTNQLPVQLAKPIQILKAASPVSEFTYTDTCSGKRLTHLETCTVTITLTPLVSGTKYVQLTIAGYDDNEVPLPEVTTVSGGTITSGVTGAATQSLFNEMTQGTNGDFTFTFTNYGDVEATNVIGSVTPTAGTATIVSNTCGDSSTPGTIPTAAESGQCVISGSYDATTLGAQTLTANLTFDDASGSPLAPFTTTTVVSSTTSGDVLGSLVVPYYLPPLMTQSESYPIHFLFTNVSDSEVNFSGDQVGSIACTDGNQADCGSCDSTGCSSGALISGFSSNCNTALPYASPAAACEVQVSFNAPAATSPVTTYTVTASLPYTTDGGTPASALTAGTVTSVLPTTRKVELINECDFDVWFSLNGASVAGSCSQTTGLGCSPGTSCDMEKGTCFWTNPAPTAAASGASTLYQLPSGGGTNSVTIPAYNYGGVQWSGNISASLNCDGSTTCEQAACMNDGGSSACYPGKGFTQPATEAEVTMNAGSADSYDVGTINGFHIPIAMEPIYYDDGTTTIVATPDAYTCGVPGQTGSDATDNGFGSCNWKTVSLPSPSAGTGYSSGYYWVTGGGSACDIASGAKQCGDTALCGIAIDTNTNTLSTVCGNFLGYWTGDQVCSYAGIPDAVNSFFNCTVKLSSLSASSGLPFPSGATLYDLMSCVVPKSDPYPLYSSCYNTYSGSSTAEIQTCCGCVDWWDFSETGGVTIVSNDQTQSCGSQVDPVWTQYVRPMVQWMKAACPSVYTYQFDDKTSGFSCSNNLQNQANSLGYRITFCKLNSGKPTGITEGR